MATKLDKQLKREIDVDGKPYMLAITPEGLIATQRDRFDFWAWSRQALGAPGLLLGWTPMLKNKVRAGAAKNLAAYMARTP